MKYNKAWITSKTKQKKTNNVCWQMITMLELCGKESVWKSRNACNKLRTMYLCSQMLQCLNYAVKKLCGKQGMPVTNYDVPIQGVA